MNGGEVEYEIVPGRHGPQMIAHGHIKRVLLVQFAAEVEARVRPSLLHRCELEAAGVLLVECFHFPRFHIPDKVDGKALRTDR